MDEHMAEMPLVRTSGAFGSSFVSDLLGESEICPEEAVDTEMADGTAAASAANTAGPPPLPGREAVASTGVHASADASTQDANAEALPPNPFQPADIKFWRVTLTTIPCAFLDFDVKSF